MPKYHVKRKDDTLCGLHINQTRLICHHAEPAPVGSQRHRFFIWINSRHMLDVEGDAVCQKCRIIAEGG